MSASIMFLCVEAGHMTPHRDPSSKNLTVHKGKWAACPAGREAGHRWQATTGLDYEELFRKRVDERPVSSRA
jgi:hypothetical protein